MWQTILRKEWWGVSWRKSAESSVLILESVITVIERTKQKASTDRAFKKRMEKLKMDLTVSQEQT